MSASCCRMGYIATERVLKPWLLNDTVFWLSAVKTRQNECLKVLHAMTNSVIRKRRQELMAERATQSTERNEEDESGKFRAGVQMSNKRRPSVRVCSAVSDTKGNAGL